MFRENYIQITVENFNLYIRTNNIEGYFAKFLSNFCYCVTMFLEIWLFIDMFNYVRNFLIECI